MKRGQSEKGLGEIAMVTSKVSRKQGKGNVERNERKVGKGWGLHSPTLIHCRPRQCQKREGCLGELLVQEAGEPAQYKRRTGRVKRTLAGKRLVVTVK